MVAQERPPSLRWRPSVSDHVFGDRRLGDVESEFQQFTMDARGAPQRVLLAHPLDELAQLTVNFGPSWSPARFPAPIGPKPCSMPPQDRGRLNDVGQTEQAWPEPSHPYQQCPVKEPRSRHRRSSSKRKSRSPSGSRLSKSLTGMTVGTPSIPPGGRRLSEHRQKKAERRHAVRAPACAYRGEAEEGEINGQHLDCQTDAHRDWPWGIRRDQPVLPTPGA